MNASHSLAVTVILVLSGISARALQPHINLEDSAWARVRHLPVSSEIEIQRRDRPSLRSLFADADATSLTVVNLSDLVVTDDLRQKVGAMLRHHPDAFVKERPVPVAEGNLRLGPDGLFAGRGKLAERDELIEVIDRAAVLKIVTAERPTSWLNAKRGALIGLGIGAAIGYAAGSRCGPGAAPSECKAAGVTVAFFSGAAGAGAGALIGSDFRPIPERTLVYSAP